MVDEALNVVLLADRPDLIPVVARWHWDEWGAGAPDASLEDWTEAARRRSGRDRIPLMWVALVAGRATGSVALVEHDMATHPDLSPWLSSVFVIPDRRGAGIGSALVAHAEDEARRLGCARLYLWTDAAEPFYARRGWSVIGRELYDRSVKAIMARDLRAPGD